jgi:hypothetical protein
MINQANAKAQAKLLSQELRQRGTILNHSEALDLIAKLQGFRSWLEFAVAAQKAEDLAKLSVFARLKVKLQEILKRF